MNTVRTFSIAAACALATSFASVASAQATNPADLTTEAAPVLQVQTPPTGPVGATWTFKKGQGTANLTINADGTYLFSGQYGGNKPNKDFDITFALKGSTGAILLFHYMGGAANGVQWSDQGQSEILKDDFATFAGKMSWTAEYHFSETSAARRAEYEAKKHKLEALRKAEEEARKKHDAKLAAEKRAERRREEQAELAQEQAIAQQHQGGGGGGGIVSTIGDVCSGISSVAGDIGGAVNAVESLFSF
jgi:hypothetical protein